MAKPSVSGCRSARSRSRRAKDGFRRNVTGCAFTRRARSMRTAATSRPAANSHDAATDVTRAGNRIAICDPNAPTSAPSAAYVNNLAHVYCTRRRGPSVARRERGAHATPARGPHIKAQWGKAAAPATAPAATMSQSWVMDPPASGTATEPCALLRDGWRRVLSGSPSSARRPPLPIGSRTPECVHLEAVRATRADARLCT